MGVWIDSSVYNAIINAGGEKDVEKDGNDYWFYGDWEDYGLTVQNGGVYKISLKPSQKGVFIGNYEG